MRHKRKNDYDFGECYSVGKRDGKEVLIIENDENILEEVYIYYFAHCKCLADNMRFSQQWRRFG